MEVIPPEVTTLEGISLDPADRMDLLESAIEGLERDCGELSVQIAEVLRFLKRHFPDDF
jgi:hypothetical protein